jgi:hypothetical protein
MTFTTDRKTVTEGEIVEVRWECPGAERVELTIDNGYKTSVIPLELSGSKRFRLHRSKGRTRLVLTAYVDGKGFSKVIQVKVKEMPVTKAETVDHQGRTMSRLRQWLNMPKWQTFWRNYKMSRQALPKEKRLASRMLLMLGGAMLLRTFAPALLGVGMMAIAIYLIWVIYKR